MSDQITVIHEYHAAYNAVTQPDKYVACTRYFIARWMPLLGGTGTQIVLALRSLGYYNPKTNEKRDGIEIDLPALAKMCGCSPDTIKREFGYVRPKKGEPKPETPQLQNPTLHKFVQRESQYYREAVTGNVMRAASVYRVKMDDPLHEDDLPKLQEELAKRDKPNRGKVQNASYDATGGEQVAPDGVQTADYGKQIAPRKAQSAPRKVQNAPALKDDLRLPEKTLTTLDTPREQPVPPQDTQAVRSFAFKGEEKRQEKKEPDDGLTTLQRAKLKNPTLFRAARQPAAKQKEVGDGRDGGGGPGVRGGVRDVGAGDIPGAVGTAAAVKEADGGIQS